MTLSKHLVLAATFTGLLLGGAALTKADDAHHPKEEPKAAQAAPQGQRMEPGKGMGMMPDGMMGMMGNCPMMGGPAKNADAIKAELGITEAQKAVWEGFAAVQTKAKAGMQEMQVSMKKMMEAKSPVERLDTRLAAMELHLNSLKEFKTPLKALYDALSDEQKKKAETALAGVGCMM